MLAVRLVEGLNVTPWLLGEVSERSAEVVEELVALRLLLWPLKAAAEELEVPLPVSPSISPSEWSDSTSSSSSDEDSPPVKGIDLGHVRID